MSLGGNIFSSMGSGSPDTDYSTDQGKTLLTIKGDSAKIEGKLVISKSIEIDCEIHGELVVDGQLIIQQSGYVNADVKTIDATVNGVYEGNMEATGNVQITQSGKVNGNIKTDSLIIEKGGIFSGNVTRISNVDVEKKNEQELETLNEIEYKDMAGYKAERPADEFEVEESVKTLQEKEEDTLEL
ncbi:MAG: polymer-forming cytoskeletal protein [Actinobacteria bacterium]|nr:polymer-forming cytoskeletal protein [Actinomycetota bacterium]MCL6087426.1 polymer-forming cytoskeletal protein [Actinomycetota bacterium]